ncbi:MAG: cytochrome c oxidase assembly protein, partial [Desulfuromonadales bacterium]
MITRILSAWSCYPSVIGGVLVLLVVYLAVTRLRPPPRFAWFALGLLTIVVALLSPLDILSDQYLFSAHMIQHLLLVLVAPPLLLAGLPELPVRQLMTRKIPGCIEKCLGYPLVAWILGIGTLWIWHLPALYSQTLADQRVHIAEHLSFLVTGTVFWWPLVGPAASQALNTFFAMVYLFTAALANSILGIIFAFAPTLIYTAYQNPDDSLQILKLLRENWGLSPLLDQQLGGLIMWVGGGLIFL